MIQSIFAIKNESNPSSAFEKGLVKPHEEAVVCFSCECSLNTFYKSQIGKIHPRARFWPESSCNSAFDAIINSIQKQSPPVIIATSSFGLIINKSDGFDDWHSATAAIRLRPNSAVEVLANETIVNSRYSKMTTFPVHSGAVYAEIDPVLRKEFTEEDVCNTQTVMRTALCSSGVLIDNVDGFIFTNRSNKALHAITTATHIPENKVFYSRELIGHSGCMDLATNFNTFQEKVVKAGPRIVCVVCHGLGYTWKAIILRLEQV